MVRSLVRRVLNSVSSRPGALGKAARRLKGEVEPDDVAELYRMFLGREPESLDAVREKLGTHWRDVVEDFLRSQEFDQHNRRELAEQMLTRINTFDTTVDVPREVLDEIFRQTQAYWHSMGDDPQTAYWSVLTDERWQRIPDDELVAAFYETGRVDAEYMVDKAQELRPEFAIENARVLDFGCGLGRMLRHFVGRAAYCEGWDFSAPHLELLEKNFSRLFGLDRERFGTRVVSTLDFRPPETRFDLVYSVLTLQHNPPPVMAHMLRELLRCLGPGGIALIHLPTVPVLDGYEFSAEDYRTGAQRGMETHALPRDAVFRIAREEGVTVPWARYDHRCGPGFFEEMFAFARD